jgi:hypothetical protein
MSFTSKKHKRKKIKTKSKKQKIYSMRGCSKYKCNKHKGGSGCGNTDCPIAPYAFKGGNKAFFGEPWGTSINKWSGVDGLSGNRNHYSLMNTTLNPQQQMLLKGGKRKRISRKLKGHKLKGGGLLPQDLVNLGRDVMFNAKSASNILNGYELPTDPSPYRGHLLNNNKIIF